MIGLFVSLCTRKILRTPVFVFIKYPDIVRESLTDETNVATRSRTVWLQMNTLTVFLAVCFCVRRLMSIARLAMKPEIQMMILDLL